MTVERWDQLRQQLQSANLIESEERSEVDGVTTQTIISRSPKGQIKLEFIVKPRFLGMQTTYTRRIGAAVTVTPQYSNDETVTVLNLYEWIDGEWVGMKEKSPLFQ